MDPNHEIENFSELSTEIDAGETASVDDFIRQLEAKEKDLHITADTSIIEITESFDDADDMPELMREAASEPKPSAAAPAVPEKSVLELEETITRLYERIDKMEADRDEQFKNSQRRARDFETFKTRTERERSETYKTQIGNLATQILPALDNLNRALDFAEPGADEKDAEFKQFFEGIVLVNQEINDVLERMGVTAIPAVGETFDPHLHEAIAAEVNDDLPPNTVSQEVLRGYRIGEKVIRHSMVKVTQASGTPRARSDDEFSAEFTADGEQAGRHE